ncbi:MAG: PKD domain-containing protein [Flavobacteriales bacterium]|nr:PKD domain-containing protein [Flavobacteriales bacterium]
MKQLLTFTLLVFLSLDGFSQGNCNAYFNAYYYAGIYNFNPNAPNGNSSFSWDFGDGSTSSEMYPVYVFSTPGIYIVCLHVTNEDLSCDETYCTEITVCSGFNLGDISVFEMDENTYSFENTNSEYDVVWFANPGSWTSTDNPFQTDFLMSGNYEVTAMATGESYPYNWVDNQGNIQTLVYYCMDSVTVSLDITLSEFATISGYVFSDLNANAVMDSGEGASDANSSVLIESNGMLLFQNTDANGYFEAQVSPGTYFVASTIGIYYSYYYGISLPTTLVETVSYGETEGYGITMDNGDVFENLNFGVVSTHSVISGIVFGDENANGAQEINEYGIPFHGIYVDGNYVGSTNSNGSYSISVLSDDHTISINFPGEITAPESGVFEIINPNQGQAFSNFDFGVLASGADLEVNISMVSPHVPGSVSSIWVASYNHGVVQNDVVTTILLDPMVEFQSATVNGTYDELTHSVTWTSNFNALSFQYYDVFVLVDTGAELGEQVVYTATINGSFEDGNLSNNTSTHQSNVVASYDPNMKQVSPAGEHLEGFVQANENMQYTLHFQNTGSYYAMNVVITDELPQVLDPSTIQVMSSSHPCTAIYLDGILRFTFSNIMLPWQEMDEDASQGFVTFRIQQDEDLAPGTAIENEVNIYFDFNDPVLTNTALNTIVDPVNIAVIESSKDFGFTISPVPTNDRLNLTWNKALEDGMIYISDIYGKRVMSSQATGRSIQLDVTSLAVGIYTLRVMSHEQVLEIQKFVKN